MATFTATSGVRFTDTDDRVSFTAGFQSVSTSGGVTDHGALTGLGDDDHTQYALADGTRGAFAAASHTHSASDITSGTLATARLGSGTASSSTFLRGDGTWATPAGWRMLHNVTLESDLGTVASPLSYGVTGFSLFKVTFYGNSIRNATTDSLRITVNADTGNVYSTDAGTLTSAWVCGTIPGAQTNTDRIAQVAVEFGGISGSLKAGRAEATGINSTSTVGAIDADVGLFSTITAAITSIQVFGAQNALRAGSRIIIEGLA